MTPGNFSHRLHIVNTQGMAAAQVVGIFKYNQPGAGKMNIVRADGTFNIR